MPSKEEIITSIKKNGRKKTKKELKLSHKMFGLICNYYEINLDEIHNENVKKIICPDKNIIQKEVLEEPLVQLCKKYNCTDNGIRKFINKYKLFYPYHISKSYWQLVKYNKFPPITMSDLYLDENGAYQLKPEKMKLYQK